MKEMLKQVILDQREQLFAMQFVPRSVPSNLLSLREILVISGVRRCGKSTLLRQIRELQAEKDFYLNFDDERLSGFTVNDFQTLTEVFISLFGEQHTYYLDEIQSIAGWERFVRRLYDSGNKVFVTGSNASMLSRELGTHLTGRYLQFELFPFSFAEYLQLKKISVAETDFFTTKGKATLYRELEEYMKSGGFPQFIQNNEPDYLKSLFESILYRDVMVRNKLTNEREMLELVRFLASNLATLSTNSSLARIIGVKNPATVKNYIEFLNNSYLLFQVFKFDYSLNKQVQNAKKTYFIDLALAKRLGFSFSENIGRMLENLVYLELLRRKKEVFYHSGKYECDFLVRDGYDITEAIQVCHSLQNEETRQREIKGLSEAMDTHKLSDGLIITFDTAEEFTLGEKNIKIVQAWKWLLTAPFLATKT